MIRQHLFFCVSAIVAVGAVIPIDAALIAAHPVVLNALVDPHAGVPGGGVESGVGGDPHDINTAREHEKELVEDKFKTLDEWQSSWEPFAHVSITQSIAQASEREAVLLDIIKNIPDGALQAEPDEGWQVVRDVLERIVTDRKALTDDQYHAVMSALVDKSAVLLGAEMSSLTPQSYNDLWTQLTQEGEAQTGLGPIPLPIGILRLIDREQRGKFLIQLVKAIDPPHIAEIDGGLELLSAIARDVANEEQFLTRDQRGRTSTLSAIEVTFANRTRDAVKAKVAAATSARDVGALWDTLIKTTLPSLPAKRREQLIKDFIAAIPEGTFSANAVDSLTTANHIAADLRTNGAKLGLDSSAVKRITDTLTSRVVSGLNAPIDELVRNAAIEQHMKDYLVNKVEYDYQTILDLYGQQMQSLLTAWHSMKAYEVYAPDAFTTTKISVAQRLANLEDFIEGQSSYYARGNITTISNWFKSMMSGLLTNQKAVLTDVRSFLRTASPEFLASQNLLEEIYRNDQIPYLPEDVLLVREDQMKDLASRIKADMSFKELAPLLAEVGTLARHVTAKKYAEIGDTHYSLIDLMEPSERNAFMSSLSTIVGSIVSEMNIPQIVTNIERLQAQEKAAWGKPGEETIAKTVNDLYQALSAFDQLLNSEVGITIQDHAASGSVKEVLDALLKGERDRIAWVERYSDITLSRLEANTEDLASPEMAESLATLLTELQLVADTTFVSAKKKEEIFDRMDEVRGWQEVVNVAEQIKKLESAESASGEIYTAVRTSLDLIEQEMGYDKSGDDFTRRLQLMDAQGRALDAALKLLSSQKTAVSGTSVTYTIPEIADLLAKHRDNSTLLDAATLKALADAGFLQRQTVEVPEFIETTTVDGKKRRSPLAVPTTTVQSEMYVRTPAAVAVTELAERINVHTLRVEQLKGYVDAHKAGVAPSLEISVKGRRIPLAETLRLQLFIPIDQYPRLESAYNVTINNSSLARTMAQIDTSSQRNVHDDEEAPVRSAIADLPTLDAAGRMNMLRDLDDLLELHRADLVRLNVTPYLEATIKFQLRIETAPPEEREKLLQNMKITDVLDKILGSNDPQGTLNATPDNLVAATLSLFKMLGSQSLDSMKRWSLWWQQQRLQKQQGVSKATLVAALPVGAGVYAGSQYVGASGAAVLGSTTGFGLLGMPEAIGGTLAGYAVGTMYGDIVAIFAGTGAAFTTGFAAWQMRVTDDQITALKKTFTEYGLDPNDVKIGDDWGTWSYWTNLAKKATGVDLQDTLSRAWEWMSSTQVNGYIRELEAYRTILDERMQELQTARGAFYEKLGIDKNSTADEAAAAIQLWKQKLDRSWGVQRWLMTREFNRYYRAMLMRGQAAASSYVEYNRLANQVMVKAIETQVSRSGVESLGKYAAQYEGIMGALWAEMIKVNQGNETFTVHEVPTLAQKAVETFMLQSIGLASLKETLAFSKDNISRASIFNDSTIYDSYAAFIEGRTQQISTDFEREFGNFLSGLGLRQMHAG